MNKITTTIAALLFVGIALPAQAGVSIDELIGLLKGRSEAEMFAINDNFLKSEVEWRGVLVEISPVVDMPSRVVCIIEYRPNVGFFFGLPKNRATNLLIGHKYRVRGQLHGFFPGDDAGYSGYLSNVSEVQPIK